MNLFRRFVLLGASLLIGGCASVATEIVRLNPAQAYAPTQHVEVLLARPGRPHVDIALIESRGGSEAELLNDARAKARELGADAIVRLDTERHLRPPVVLYDPWLHEPFPGSPWGHRLGLPWGPWGHGAYGYPWGPHTYVPGGVHYVLKAMAIKYAGSG